MPEWHKLTVEETLKKLDTSEKGLSEQAAKDRLAEHGPNELAEKGARSAFGILLEQFAQTMVIILIVAAIISAFIGDWLEAGAIMAIVLMFATLGFIQDYRADRAMAALRSMAVPEARARRDGADATVSARDLAPGDVIYLEAGNVVPADLRLMEANDLKIDEAALTGESESVSKRVDPLKGGEDLPLGDRVNMAFSGTVVSAGRGIGVITETGMATQMGDIAAMIQDEESGRTPMQRELDRVGRILAACGVAISAVVAGIGYYYLDQPLKEMFLVAVSLAVAVVPEGLPAVVTMTLSLGSQRMLKRNALIRKLPAVETLGSVTTICTDKTGTLTENRMTAVAVRVVEDSVDLSKIDSPEKPSIEKHDAEKLKSLPERAQLLIACGALCNDARMEWDEENNRVRTLGDPTEGALRAAATRVGLSFPALESAMERTHEVSFDSDRKRMTTFHKLPDDPSSLPGGIGKMLAEGGAGAGAHIAITKGAVDQLLEIITHAWTESGITPVDEGLREAIVGDNRTLTRRGMRVLGLGVRFLDAAPESVDASEEKDLCFLGLFGIIDPPRPEVRAAVDKCRAAGIRPIMITGDHPLTAINIAQELGITDSDHVLTGAELNNMSERELAHAVKDTSVFARVTPRHKLRIVAALKENGEICSMTGDGVNDAPALKSADIGVAMGITGTDVSKEAADMVLLDDNYATIVAAVEEGRTIGDNVRRFVKYSIAGNIGKVLVMMCAPLFGISLALMPLQLLWLNLITDGLLGLGMAVEPPEKNTMSRPPRKPDEGVFSRGGVAQVFLVGTTIGAVALGVGAWYFHNGGDRIWQTVIFTLIAFLQVGQALAMRSDRESIFTMGLFGNPLILWMCLGILALQTALLYVPFFQTFFKTVALSPVTLGICAAFGLTAFVVVEIWKIFRRGGEGRRKREETQDKIFQRQCRQLESVRRGLEEQREMLDHMRRQLTALADPEHGKTTGGRKKGVQE